MTEKRFTVDSFIDSYEVGLEDPLTNYTMEIRDNGNTMTYKECCNILNELNEEKPIIKKRD